MHVNTYLHTERAVERYLEHLDTHPSYRRTVLTGIGHELAKLFLHARTFPLGVIRVAVESVDAHDIGRGFVDMCESVGLTVRLSGFGSAYHPGRGEDGADVVVPNFWYPQSGEHVDCVVLVASSLSLPAMAPALVARALSTSPGVPSFIVVPATTQAEIAAMEPYFASRGEARPELRAALPETSARHAHALSLGSTCETDSQLDGIPTLFTDRMEIDLNGADAGPGPAERLAATIERLSGGGMGETYADQMEARIALYQAAKFLRRTAVSAAPTLEATSQP